MCSVNVVKAPPTSMCSVNVVKGPPTSMCSVNVVKAPPTSMCNVTWELVSFTRGDIIESYHNTKYAGGHSVSNMPC